MTSFAAKEYCGEWTPDDPKDYKLLKSDEGYNYLKCKWQYKNDGPNIVYELKIKRGSPLRYVNVDDRDLYLQNKQIIQLIQDINQVPMVVGYEDENEVPVLGYQDQVPI